MPPHPQHPSTTELADALRRELGRETADSLFADGTLRILADEDGFQGLFIRGPKKEGIINPCMTIEENGQALPIPVMQPALLRRRIETLCGRNARSRGIMLALWASLVKDNKLGRLLESFDGSSSAPLAEFADDSGETGHALTAVLGLAELHDAAPAVAHAIIVPETGMNGRCATRRALVEVLCAQGAESFIRRLPRWCLGLPKDAACVVDTDSMAALLSPRLFGKDSRLVQDLTLVGSMPACVRPRLARLLFVLRRSRTKMAPSVRRTAAAAMRTITKKLGPETARRVCRIAFCMLCEGAAARHIAQSFMSDEHAARTGDHMRLAHFLTPSLFGTHQVLHALISQDEADGAHVKLIRAGAALAALSKGASPTSVAKRFYGLPPASGQAIVGAMGATDAIAALPGIPTKLWGAFKKGSVAAIKVCTALRVSGLTPPGWNNRKDWFTSDGHEPARRWLVSSAGDLLGLECLDSMPLFIGFVDWHRACLVRKWHDEARAGRRDPELHVGRELAKSNLLGLDIETDALDEPLLREAGRSELRTALLTTRTLAKGMSVTTALRLSLTWHEAVAAMRHKGPDDGATWPASPFPETSIGEFLFSPLAGIPALVREGELMHNCVASYASRCRAGESHIYSVTCADASRPWRGTLEIVKENGHHIIGQLLGPCNSQAPDAATRAAQRLVGGRKAA